MSNNNECKACNPNHKEQEFSKVVARWETIRHYKVKSHDTIRNVCDDMDKRDMSKCFDEKCKERECNCEDDDDQGEDNNDQGEDEDSRRRKCCCRRCCCCK